MLTLTFQRTQYGTSGATWRTRMSVALSELGHELYCLGMKNTDFFGCICYVMLYLKKVKYLLLNLSK